MEKTISATRTVYITKSNEIPKDWGPLRLAEAKSPIAVREPTDVETFKEPWGTLTAIPGTDLVIIQDSGEEHPIKKEIFKKTYEPMDHGRFRKKTVSRMVQVPKGVFVALSTLEGEITVTHPDYVVIGEAGEVYANTAEWVNANLVFVDQDLPI